MIEVQINRLPGGDATRRSTMARITLTNTGEGLGGVKFHEVTLAEARTKSAARQLAPT